MRSFVTQYSSAVQQALGTLDAREIERVVDVLMHAYHTGRHVFTLGNGASAALASHMACDLGKGTALDLGEGAVDSGLARLKVISLVDNTPLATAYGNDISYDDIFVEQLKNLLEPGDVVIGISGSGGSPNVLRALRYARERHATTIAFTGYQPKSHLIRELSDIVVRPQLTVMEQIEDVHVVIHHMVTMEVRARIALAAVVARPTPRVAVVPSRRARRAPVYANAARAAND